MRIRVKILEPISSPFGTSIIDDNGKFIRWMYCRNINGKWYFEKFQTFVSDCDALTREDKEQA